MQSAPGFPGHLPPGTAGNPYKYPGSFILGHSLVPWQLLGSGNPKQFSVKRISEKRGRTKKIVRSGKLFWMQTIVFLSSVVEVPIPGNCLAWKISGNNHFFSNRLGIGGSKKKSISKQAGVFEGEIIV